VQMHWRQVKVVAALLTFACICACSTATSIHQTSHKSLAAQQLAKISLPDGISKNEAEAIAEYFFYYHSNVGCGAPGTITETPESWSVATHVGYAGDPGDDIIISKTDGSVRWRGARCIDNPLSMLDEKGHVSRCISE